MTDLLDEAGCVLLVTDTRRIEVRDGWLLIGLPDPVDEEAPSVSRVVCVPLGFVSEAARRTKEMVLAN